MSMKVIHLEQVLEWVDGKPVAKYNPIIDKDAVADLPLAVMGICYKRTPLEIELGVDEEFEGLTMGEVMMLRLAYRASRGSRKATNDLLDIILGKPKSTADIRTVTYDYKDYLKELKDKVNIEEAEFNIDSL